MKYLTAFVISIIAGIAYIIFMLVMAITSTVLFFDKENPWASNLQDEILGP